MRSTFKRSQELGEGWGAISISNVYTWRNLYHVRNGKAFISVIIKGNRIDFLGAKKRYPYPGERRGSWAETIMAIGDSIKVLEPNAYCSRNCSKFSVLRILDIEMSVVEN